MVHISSLATPTIFRLIETNLPPEKDNLGHCYRVADNADFRDCVLFASDHAFHLRRIIVHVAIILIPLG